jgi:sodium-dependent dicarboxylate transporter 2/3/5
LGLLLGPLLGLVFYLLLPSEYVSAAGKTVAFTAAGKATVAVTAWMAVWWLTEAIDVHATALLPIALFPLFGVATAKAACAPYGDELIFLFLGGFLLALAMQRWGLDVRIALGTLRLVGTRPASIVLGLMIATAAISAVVSNTATAAMMLPIGLGVIDLVLQKDGGRSAAKGTPSGNFAVGSMLAIAYASSIGGIATIIGTPPNVFTVGFLRDKIAPAFRTEISFVQWLGIGVPLAVIYLPIAWFLLTRLLFPVSREPIEGAADLIAAARRKLGPMKRAERVVLVAFALTSMAWMLRPILAKGAGPIPPLLPGASDAMIGIFAGLLLFVIPSGEKGSVLDWSTAAKVPYGILILFGGGLSLAAAIEANGVAELLGAKTTFLGGAPEFIVVAAVTTLVIFLTELTSNTATTAALVPIFAAMAPGLGCHPLMLAIPATLAASCAFMLPAGTPPNAIVFGSGYVTIPEMCRAGIWLNLVGVVLITALTFAVVGPLLGS